MSDTGLRLCLKVALCGAVLVAAGCPKPSSQSQPPQPPPVVGLADYHNHQFAYLGFGGMAITHSIDPTAVCSPPPGYDRDSLAVKDVVRQGLFATAADQLAGGNCAPMIGSAASQRVDTDNLMRAWQYGLRLIVVLAVNSEFLCEVGRFDPCPTDRAAIEQQLQAARDLQDKIDMDAGGAGLGWYRIVTSPAEARQVISQGKLAVVLGIEAANAFGCRIRDWNTVGGIRILPGDTTGPEAAYINDCDEGLIRDLPLRLVPAIGGAEELKKYGSQATHKALALFEHYWQLGVRHFFLTHNIDGIAAGTALGIDLLHAETNPSGSGVGAVDDVIRGIRPPHAAWSCSSQYSFDGGRCNVRGLSDLGRDLVKLAAAHGAVIDADHLSMKAKNELLGSTGVLGGVYPLVSTHSGVLKLAAGNESNESVLSESDIGSIIRAGGAFAPRLPAATSALPSTHPEFPDGTYPVGTTVAPHTCPGTAESYIQAYRYLVDKLSSGKLINGKPAFVGVGIGTDFGPPIPLFSAPRFKTTNNVVTATSVGTPVGRGYFLRALSTLAGGPPTPPLGACYDPGAQPAVSYPFTSPLAPGTQFFKSVTPWDGRATQPGYDISLDGVPHVGMLPDLVEEIRVLGVDVQPLWNGAEAYIRAWETAEAWESSFDAEGTRSVRADCEQHRRTLLQGEDAEDPDVVVAAIKSLRTAGCRGIPAQ
jgi:microsomal dipeptidase-like Zn-dependent dipeptidase